MTFTTFPDTSVLDIAMWQSLVGAHAHLSEGRGRARRYLPTVAPFVAVDDADDPQTWTDLAQLIGPGQDVAIPRDISVLPDGWSLVMTGPGVQMVGSGHLAAE